MAKTLLLADDSITIQKVVNLTFAEEDIDVESVTNGDQAVEMARDIRPAIVLADVIMPGRNGYEVCASIKADPDLSGIPVVLLVGTFEPFDEVEASRVKCDAYLTKPFDTSELIELVHSLIEKASGNGDIGRTAEEETTDVPAAKPMPQPRSDGLVSSRAMESFLGSNSILDLFDSQVRGSGGEPAALQLGQEKEELAAEVSEAPLIAPDSAAEAPETPPPQLQVIPFPSNRSHPSEPPSSLSLSEELLETIVERVVKRMSDVVIRDIAWDVVPEQSERIIREYLRERDKADDH